MSRSIVFATRPHPGCAPLVAVASLVAAACARPAEPWLCPEAREGELVVTEVRGVQEDSDTYGQWIELYSSTSGASSGVLDLRGLRVVLIAANGIDRQQFLVRDSLELGSGSYVVLGHQDPDALPGWIDYGFFVDLHREVESDPDGATDDAPAETEWAPADLYTEATMEIEACGELVDRIEYAELPALGTLALDGAIAPDATANDDPTAWCNDATPPPAGEPMTELGIPGTPGEANPPCG